MQLILHIESDVEFNLTSGRINVQELLSSELIHFWAIVSREPVRRVLYYTGGTALAEVLDDLGVPFDRGLAEWSVSVCPSPDGRRRKAGRTQHGPCRVMIGLRRFLVLESCSDLFLLSIALLRTARRSSSPVLTRSDGRGMRPGDSNWK